MTIAQQDIIDNVNPRKKHPKPSLTTIGDVIIEEKRRINQEGGYTIHRYRLGKVLGRGGSATVYKCTSLDTGKEYAIKIISKQSLTKARTRFSVSL